MPLRDPYGKMQIQNEFVIGTVITNPQSTPTTELTAIEVFVFSFFFSDSSTKFQQSLR